MKVALPAPGDAVEAFVVANLGFLGADIALAHAANRFARPEEWIPIGFSALATLALLPGLASRSVRVRTRLLAILIALGAVAIGVAGMLYHLESGFFASQTLKNLVYSAPFVAPLSYVGVGLLLLLCRMEPPGSAEWNRWVLLLALGGFAGNLGLSLLDHAQNGFFRPLEWLSVAAAAFAVGFLAIAPLRVDDRRYLDACLAVLAIVALVGVAGFALHLAADLGRPGADLLHKAMHGAPLFAPLLFANLSLLGAIGLLSCRARLAT